MDETRSCLQVCLLGPPVVIHRGEIGTIPRRKAEALLYYLISEQRAHPRDKLATLLWEKYGDTRARRNLSNAITALRRALDSSVTEQSYILAEGDTLRFNTAADYRLDTAAFEHLTTTGLKEAQEQGVALPATCARLKEAVELNRGEFLEGFTLEKCKAFQDWVSQRQQRLLNLLVEALQVLAQHHERRGEYRQAVAFVSRLSRIDDWDENWHRWLMRLYSLDGDRAAAVRQYELCQQILEREGMPVSPETEGLYQRILREKTVPRQRERYELRAELGRGRMGVVYRVWDTLLEREVALKVLSEAGLGKEGQVRFRRESRVLARLKHPNIVTLYEIGERSGVPYIAMELVEGRNLSQISHLDIPQALDIVMQMCAALEHAHRQGVIHRDIRPENVMLTRDGTVKVLDFGLARIIERASLTGSGELIGTPLYMSPEQVRGGAVDHRSDLYALGAVLYKLVAGRPPFQGDPWQVIRAHLEDSPPSPRLLNPAVSSALERTILKLLAKSPQERFSSAAEAGEALGELLREDVISPAVAAPPKVAAAQLVGRDEELRRLAHRWRGVLEERESHLVFLCGEPGIGKTRLAEEFISHVQRQPSEVLILQGSCREPLMGVPYAPWTNALRGYLRTFPDEEMQEVVGAEAAGLARLVPELLERFPLAPQPLPALDPQAERQRLFDQVAGFLLRLSQSGPLLFLLDDLHWADAASLELLEHVLQRTEGGQVLLLGTYRDEEVGAEHPLRKVQRRMRRTQRTSTIALSRLDAVTVEQLVKVLMGGQEINPDLAETIYRETEGNPLFAKEMLNALLEEGEIRLTAAGWERWRKGDLIVPGSVQAVLDRRLDRLSEGCRNVLMQASVMGQEFDFDVLGVLVSLGEEELLDLLDEALETRLVNEVRIGEQEVHRFHHALVARVLYERLSSRRRALLHRRIGRIMELLYVQDLAARADELAYHFFQGVRGDQGREEALHYSLLAAKRAESVYANQEAAHHYRRALSLLSGSGQEIQRLEILEHLADVYATLEPRQALPLYEETLSLWRETGGDRVTGARLHRKLARLMEEWAGIVLDIPRDWKRIEALAEAGLKLLGDAPPYIERLRLLLVWTASAPDNEITWRRGKEAIVLADRLGAVDELAQALEYLHWVYRERGELCQARDLFSSRLDQIEQKASLQTRAYTHRLLGQVLFFAGEYPQAINYLERARQEHERTDHALLVCSSQFFIAYSYLQWDRWSEAYQSGVKALEMRRKYGLGPWFIPLLLARVQAAWGDIEGAKRRRLEALEEKEEFQPRVFSYLAAQLSIAEGDFATALRILEDILSWVPPYYQIHDYVVYPYLSECLVRSGDGERALHYAALAEDVVRQGGGKPWLALTLRAQGLVYIEQEKWGQAKPRLEEALALFREMGCRWEEGRTLVDLAHLYRKHGKAGDRERAWQHYQEALKLFEELWAKPDVERVQQEMLDL